MHNRLITERVLTWRYLLSSRQSRGLRVDRAADDQNEAHPKRRLRKLVRNQRGGTSLEWALLLGAIGIPSYYLIQAALSALVAHYQMVTTLNALPFP